MTLSPEYGAAFTAVGSAIAWLVKELVSRKKEYDAALAERQKLHDAQIANLQKAHADHTADLKAQLTTKDEQLVRHQDFYEKYTEQNRIQERAFMTLMAALGEKMATLSAVVMQSAK